MYTYTTPSVPFVLKNVEWSEVDFVRIALVVEKKKIVRELNPDEFTIDQETGAGSASIKLTQQETANLGPGRVAVQARVKYRDGTVDATQKAAGSMNRIIDEVVI